MCKVFICCDAFGKDAKFINVLERNRVILKDNTISLKNLKLLEIETQFQRERHLLCFGKINKIETQDRDNFIQENMKKHNNGDKLYCLHQKYINREKECLLSDAQFWLDIIYELINIHPNIVLFYLHDNGQLNDNLEKNDINERFILFRDLTKKILLEFQDKTLLHIQTDY